MLKNPDSFRIAAVQMQSSEDLHENLGQAREFLEQARAKSAQVVAFPECFLCLSDNTKKIQQASETLYKGMISQTLQEWSIEFDMWILAGSVFLKNPKTKKLSNASLLISPEGDIRARYDKIHLFDSRPTPEKSFKESKLFCPGESTASVKTPYGKFGLSICYDLRFPELYRKLSSQGADIFFAPSAFLKATGSAHWDVLTRARAIENQCYLVAPAQEGTHGCGRETYGHTRIIDPWGRVIAERPKGPGIVWADINLENVKKLRKEMPVLKHRAL